MSAAVKPKEPEPSIYMQMMTPAQVRQVAPTVNLPHIIAIVTKGKLLDSGKELELYGILNDFFKTKDSSQLDRFCLDNSVIVNDEKGKSLNAAKVAEEFFKGASKKG